MAGSTFFRPFDVSLRKPEGNWGFPFSDTTEKCENKNFNLIFILIQLS